MNYKRSHIEFEVVLNKILYIFEIFEVFYEDYFEIEDIKNIDYTNTTKENNSLLMSGIIYFGNDRIVVEYRTSKNMSDLTNKENLSIRYYSNINIRSGAHNYCDRYLPSYYEREMIRDNVGIIDDTVCKYYHVKDKNSENVCHYYNKDFRPFKVVSKKGFMIDKNSFDNYCRVIITYLLVIMKENIIIIVVVLLRRFMKMVKLCHEGNMRE